MVLRFSRDTNQTLYSLYDYYAVLITYYDENGLASNCRLVITNAETQEDIFSSYFIGRYSELEAYKVMQKFEYACSENGGFVVADFFEQV